MSDITYPHLIVFVSEAQFPYVEAYSFTDITVERAQELAIADYKKLMVGKKYSAPITAENAIVSDSAMFLPTAFDQPTALNANGEVL